MSKLLLSTSVALGATSLSFAQQTEKPSFLLFIADDCSHYDLGCYGSVDSKTPNTSRFATQEVRFTQTYQAAPMPPPARHNLYIGLWPVRNGVYSNHTCANEGTLSVVHHLQPLGYKVALIGKSHVAPKSVFPFDLYVPLLKGGDLNFEAIQEFIPGCKAKGEPFCLFVASNQPHTSWDKGDASQSNADRLTSPPMCVDIPQIRELFTHYLAEINYIGQEFGNVLSILDKEKMTDKSVVVYLSEQGNSLPFAKWTYYDTGVYSACIVHRPGVVKPGSVSDVLVEYVDIVPTFVDITRGKPQAKVDGESFKPVLTGGKKAHKKYSFPLQTTRGINAGSPYYGIRLVYDGRYRYIVDFTPEATFQNVETKSPLFKEQKSLMETDSHVEAMTTKYQHRSAIELYDVKNDSYCMKNLAEDAKQASTTSRLDKELERWMKDCRDEEQPTEMCAFEHIPGKRK